MHRMGTARSLIRLAVVMSIVGLAPGAWARSGPGEFEAALVRCADVNRPGPLAGCGADPLGAGEAEIRPDGRIEVEVEGVVARGAGSSKRAAEDAAAAIALDMVRAK